MKTLSVLLLFLLAGAACAQTITQAEWFFDTDPGVGLGNPITLDHLSSAGSDSAWSTCWIPAGTQSYGMHRVYWRCRSSEGPWTTAELKYYFIFTPWFGTVSERAITHVEFQFDTLAPIVRDVADAGTVTLSELISTAGLDWGMHSFRTRCRDDLGRWSGTEMRYVFIVTPPPTPLVSNPLVGGEYYVNVDPGVGNGIPFGPADDEGWDEGEESTTLRLTGIPLGTHVVGLRFRDAGGLWSPTMQDTLIVGPVLTARVSGVDIILDWIPSADAPPYRIYRADQYAGPYTAVDSTNNTTWTDVNPAAPRRYYHVRQTLPGTVHPTFRLPEAASAEPWRE